MPASKCLFANNAGTTLSSGFTAGGTSLAAVDASLFPSPAANEFAFVRLKEGSNITVLKYTSRATNTLSGVTTISGSSSNYSTAATLDCMEPAELFQTFAQVLAANVWNGGKQQFGSNLIELLGAAQVDLLTSAPASPPSATATFAQLCGLSIGSHPNVGRLAGYFPGETDPTFFAEGDLSHRFARMHWRGNGYDNQGMQVLTSGPSGNVSGLGTAATSTPALSPATRRGLLLANRLLTAATAQNAVGFWPFVNTGGGLNNGYPLVRSTAAGQGAWWAKYTFGFSSTNGTPIAASRILIGVQGQINTATGTRSLSAGASASPQDPSTQAPNLAGLCADATLTNLSVITRDNSAGGTAATTYPLVGAVTRAKTTGLNDKLYEFLLVNGPGNGSVPGAMYARWLEWDSSTFAWNANPLFDGQLNGALLPQADTFLFPVMYHDNGASAVSVGFDLPLVYFSSAAR